MCIEQKHHQPNKLGVLLRHGPTAKTHCTLFFSPYVYISTLIISTCMLFITYETMMKISPLYWQNITLFVVAVAVEADKHGNDDCFIFITYSISQSCCC